MSNLFLDQVHKLSFEKIAMPVKLSDDPSAWQREIASEIFKQIPYLGDYAVNVVVDRVDPERGFAFGSATVTNKSGAPTQESSQLPKVYIPLIVKDRLLQPMDVFMDKDGVWPLSEGRLREHLFRADTFEQSTRKPTDQGMVDALYPPMRQNYGYGSASVSGGGGQDMGKFASASPKELAVRAKRAKEEAEKSGKLVVRKYADAEGGRRQMIASMKADAARNPSMWKLGGPIGSGPASFLSSRIADLRYEEQTAPSKDQKDQARRELAEMRRLTHVKVASLMEAIAPTISEVEADDFVNRVSSDPALRTQLLKNAHFAKMAKLIAAPKVSLEKRAESLVSSIRPTVVQFQKLASGNYLVKWANSKAFAPQESEVSPQDAESMGGDQVAETGPDGTLTVTTDKAQKTTLDDEKIEQIDEFGQWKCQNVDTNEEMVGTVIPIMDFDMHPLELYVFIGDEVYAVQDQIAGVRVGHDLSVLEALSSGQDSQTDPSQDPSQAAPQDPSQAAPPPAAPQTGPQDPSMAKMGGAQPQGDGIFVHLSDSSAKALPPLTVTTPVTTADGTQQYQCETLFGEQITLTMTPDLQTIQQLGDNEYAIPDSFIFIPLQGDPVFLAKQPTDIASTESAQQMPSTVDVGSTGPGEFSLDGQPLSKVARDQKQFIKRAQAEFLLCAMGVEPSKAKEILKLAQAKRDTVKVAGLLPITPLADFHKTMVKQAATVLSHFPYHLKRDLIKEAAILEDGDTADKVLAMNFLNPENISTFASYLPDLDDAASKLAEMLVACRLGMKTLDEGAVERAMKNTETVIQGLKELQQRELV